MVDCPSTHTNSFKRPYLVLSRKGREKKTENDLEEDSGKDRKDRRSTVKEESSVVLRMFKNSRRW